MAAAHQPVGLADGIVASSLAGRGWSLDWSFEGRWEDHTHHDVWHLLFLLRPVDPAVQPHEVAACEVEGTILFNIPDGTLHSCPADHRSRHEFVQRAVEGCSTAVELVRGCYRSATRQFHVLGVDTSDPGAAKGLPPLLGLDNYKLTISPCGDRLSGISRGAGDWANHLQAIGARSILVMTRRKSLAWAMGAHARLSSDSVLRHLPLDLVNLVLFKLYLSRKNTLPELMQDHAGRRQRVNLGARAEGEIIHEGVPGC